jgi:hypothetical protein
MSEKMIPAAATKPSNPKDNFGTKKVSLSYVSMPVLMETALGMQEGGYKYGRHNYRVIGVRGSVYFDAAIRHLAAWWEGEDFDRESRANLHHISKAIASLVVLRDAMMRENWQDDRPPASERGWIERMNKTVVGLCEAFPDPVAPYTATAEPRDHRGTLSVDAKTGPMPPVEAYEPPPWKFGPI